MFSNQPLRGCSRAKHQRAWRRPERPPSIASEGSLHCAVSLRFFFRSPTLDSSCALPDLYLYSGQKGCGAPLSDLPSSNDSQRESEDQDQEMPVGTQCSRRPTCTSRPCAWVALDMAMKSAERHPHSAETGPRPDRVLSTPGCWRPNAFTPCVFTQPTDLWSQCLANHRRMPRLSDNSLKISRLCRAADYLSTMAYCLLGLGQFQLKSSRP